MPERASTGSTRGATTRRDTIACDDVQSVRRAPDPGAESCPAPRNDVIGEFFRAELAPSPARWRATARVAVACVAATLFVMWSHIPNGYWALITVFVMSQPNAGASLQRAIQRTVATLIGAALAILTISAFAEQPWFEVVALAALCGFGLFLSRTSTAPYVGMLLALTPALLIGLAGDDPTRGVVDGIFRGLWVAVGVIIGSAAQLWVLPEDPEKLLLADLGRTLRVVEEELARIADGRRETTPSTQLRAGAFEGLGRQLDWLGNAEALHTPLRERHGEQLVLIGSVHRLATATLAFSEILASGPEPFASEDRDRIVSVVRRIRRLGDALDGLPASPAAPLAERRSRPSIADAPLLEIERALDEMEVAAGLIGLVPAQDADALLPTSPLDRGSSAFFLTPAFSIRNGPAVRYALKGGVAAALAFLLVEALHWPGIGTAVVTVALVAQSSFGAMVQKATLRILGAAIGGAMGIATVVVAMPQMDTIASLLVATALACGISGYVLAGSPRISYAGTQMGLAWVLTALVEFGPSTDLVAPRDRVIGIFFGIVIALGVFRIFWPELASVGMRNSIVSALRHLGDLSRAGLVEDREGSLSRPSGGFRWQVTHDLLDAMRLAAESRLEPQSRADLGRDAQEALVRVLDAAQSTTLALLAVARRRLDAGLVAGAEGDLAALRAVASQIRPFLESLAKQIETGTGTPTPDLEAPLEALRRAAGSEIPELRVRLALYENLVRKLSQLEARSQEFAALA